MRLGAKIFLTSVLLIAILVAVAGWSLSAMQRLVAVNRGILTETLPALHAAIGVREAVPALVRLETRYVVLGDGEYFALASARGPRRTGDSATRSRLHTGRARNS